VSAATLLISKSGASRAWRPSRTKVKLLIHFPFSFLFSQLSTTSSPPHPSPSSFFSIALLGFLKVLVALKRDKKLQSLCADPRLQGKKGEPFELHMRFGLHAGWAIEGAVGSRHKVDATYLSPHVNLAARMETAATQYGVPVLMTDSFYQILSTDPRKRCRKLDVITVKGSATPRSIYTFDAHPGPLSALPSRSAFKTYSADIWKKDKVRRIGMRAEDGARKSIVV
jgi:hypothetical protein